MIQGDRSVLFRSRAPHETETIGEAIGRVLVRNGPAGAVVALAGPLGTGKTCLVRGVARGLGVSGYVRSPTFTLIHEYRGPVTLYHVDLYRLTPADVEALGLDEIVDGSGVTVIEWAEHALSVLPAEHLRVDLSFGDGDDERLLVLRPRGDRYRRVAEDVAACVSSG